MIHVRKSGLNPSEGFHKDREPRTNKPGKEKELFRLPADSGVPGNKERLDAGEILVKTVLQSGKGPKLDAQWLAAFYRALALDLEAVKKNKFK